MNLWRPKRPRTAVALGSLERPSIGPVPLPDHSRVDSPRETVDSIVAAQQQNPPMLVTTCAATTSASGWMDASGCAGFPSTTPDRTAKATHRRARATRDD